MIKRILIPLDTLLDTRLGVIKNINPEAATVLISTRDYWLREHDDWYTLTNGLVTNEQFEEAYKNRGGENTADTLNASILTGIDAFILRILAEDNINRSADVGDPNDVVGLTINYWPYVLAGEYIDELKDIVNQKYGQSIPVEIISQPLDEVTPDYLDAIYSAYITYDFREWMKIHYLALAKKMMPCFYFIGPNLFEKNVDHLTIEQKKFELFKFKIERLAHMDFDFIDAKYFSMFRPDKK